MIADVLRKSFLAHQLPRVQQALGGVAAGRHHGLEPAEYEYRAFLGSWPERRALFGFAVLDLDRDSIDVRYIDENGTEHRAERIS